VVADRANIDATLPYLMDGQREDVHFAEVRLSQPEGYGVLFTNGTGTGKTFLSLGVIKRFVKQGKSNILIVVPDRSVMNEWIDSAPALELTVNELQDKQDAGTGIVITTYSNFGDNYALVNRRFDLVVADEAHNLMQSQNADMTSSLRMFRVHTYHPDSAYERAAGENPAVYDPIRTIQERLKAIDKLLKNSDTPQDQIDALFEEDSRLQVELADLMPPFLKLVKEAQARINAVTGEARPRAMFLSATPFAYRPNIQWAEGYLFNYPKVEPGGYNTPNSYQQFMIEKFGYRMRTGMLNEPESGVDVGLMEKYFNAWLQKEGVASSRVLDIDADYQRVFALTPTAIGTLVDEGLEYLRKHNDNEFYLLHEIVEKKFRAEKKRQFLEAIKAQEAIPLIKKFHEQGRKVVVFYDFTEGGAFAPFRFETESGIVPLTIRDKVKKFYALRPDLAAIDLSNYPSPLQALTTAFPNAVQNNGVVSNKEKTKAVKSFNDDSRADVNLILVNAAKAAGWSGHDKSGKFPRAIVNLGLPTQPTRTIQQEGRIYRTGQNPDSDSVFVYMNTGTGWEYWAFAQTIAERASTAENLGMGELARGLKQSFVEGFEDSAPYTPSPADGKGGKAFDRKYTKPSSLFEQAKTFYYAQQKRNQKTKSYEVGASKSPNTMKYCS
jgi:hypothetical protein